MTLTQEQKDALRKPFPKSSIGKLPATPKRPALDFVGHAAVTDRLNAIPELTWSYTVDELLTVSERLWLRGTMTLNGVSRVEFGDGSDPKEAVGNFIRRAAMRWGVAIDLWSREELEASGGAAAPPSESATERGGKPNRSTNRNSGQSTTTPSPGSDVEGEGRSDGGNVATGRKPDRTSAPSAIVEAPGGASTTSEPSESESFGEGGTGSEGTGPEETIEQAAVRLCGGNTGKVMAYVRRKHEDWITDPELPVRRWEDLKDFHFVQIVADFVGATVDA